LNNSVQAANLSDCRIESKEIDSVARIESNRILTFLSELECSSSVRIDACDLVDCDRSSQSMQVKLWNWIVRMATERLDNLERAAGDRLLRYVKKGAPCMRQNSCEPLNLTSGQSSLTYGRIAAAHESFNLIRQVAPICTILMRGF